jgi:hypothetical protein
MLTLFLITMVVVANIYLASENGRGRSRVVFYAGAGLMLFFALLTVSGGR